MPEVTDTNKDIYPEGPTKLVINSVPLKKKTQNDKFYYEFEFEGIVNEQPRTLKIFYWPSEMRELLLAIGGKEDPLAKGKITWEKEDVKGKAITATVYHAPQRKDPTRVDVKLKEIQETVPF